MKTFEKIKLWGNHHSPKWLVIFRVALGLLLIWKGIEFIFNLDVLATFLRESGITDKISASASITVIADLIIALHLMGGICIAIGLRTRLFCLFNLPVLVGAVFFLNLKDNLLKPYAELWLAIPVLLLLIVFLIEGNGQVAVEHETDPVDEP
ncbi:DoxX family protein [Mucilaginibacter sp.]|uniref:DoxX family protein n=1 Tax=Mucilaginibacter sp. TaxID=1882438 RepID=UPI0026193A77|nr:DoxX family protein [Mucilaginibacter sp.]MDB5029874.1 DoxX family protein [Mucilaginibacter sp.]